MSTSNKDLGRIDSHLRVEISQSVDTLELDNPITREILRRHQRQPFGRDSFMSSVLQPYCGEGDITAPVRLPLHATEIYDTLLQHVPLRLIRVRITGEVLWRSFSTEQKARQLMSARAKVVA